jgi:carboxymethylenebutenolidase
MPSTRTETITAPDGGRFEGHLVLPDTGRGPGLLLIQEIGGVNGYIRSVAEKLAGLGYVVLAPDCFWRVRPGYRLEEFTPDGLQEAMGIAGQFDGEQGLADLRAALDHLRGLDEVAGAVGTLGFCFGGTMSYLLGVHDDPAAVVSYYGSGVADAIDQLGSVRCPVLFHFGSDDPYLPAEDVERIRSAAAGRDDVEVVVHDGAGHAFDNDRSPMFWNADASAAAWERTRTFLAEHLPAGS